jgi:hypothetical protein
MTPPLVTLNVLTIAPLSQVGAKIEMAACFSLCSREGGSPDWVPAFAGTQGFRRSKGISTKQVQHDEGFGDTSQ